jgi:hypothetical protein
LANGFEEAGKVEPIRIRTASGQPVGGNFFDLVGGSATF